MTVPSPQALLAGSCLCGGVRFEISVPFRRANYCHCSRCRKHSGSNASAQGRLPREGLRLLSGSELITAFHPPDGGMTKAFCRICGSALFGGTWPDGPEVSVRLGVLDGDPGLSPQYRSHVASAAAWDVACDDGLPRYDQGPPRRPR